MQKIVLQQQKKGEEKPEENLQTKKNCIGKKE